MCSEAPKERKFEEPKETFFGAKNRINVKR